MLDPRLYRVAFVPVLLAVLVAAFSIENRPRPIGTTLAPDAFNSDTAYTTLVDLVRAAPVRRPGDAGDEKLAVAVAGALRASGQSYSVRIDRFSGRTIDGRRKLSNVIATRPGAPGPGIVIVAHRDAAGRGAAAELSGTAVMLELARVAGSGRLRRTITFISTSGGSGGFAGARRAASQLEGRADAVLVLGDMASLRTRRPQVVGWSNGRGQSSLQLRRTVEAAVRTETGNDPGGPRALTQWARLAGPVTVGEQGAFVRAGQPAVLLSVSGERGPAATAPIDPRRVEAMGRAVLRSVIALDNGPDIARPPTADLVTRGKVLPAWAVRLLVGSLLLAPLIASLDAFARARRRGEPVEPWLRWTLATALPFLAAAVFSRLLGGVGLLGPSAPAPIPAPAIELGGAAIAAMAAVVLVFALGWLALRPFALRVLGLSRVLRTPAQQIEGGSGAAIAVLLTASLVAAALWVINPYAASLLIPAVHLWLLALAPGARRLPRPLCLVLVAAGLVLPALVVLADARAFGLAGGESAWFWLMLVGGGHVPVWSWLLGCLAAGCAIAAALVVLRHPPGEGRDDRPVTMRGPVGYAGPGSLGGTDSAL
jgi:hypothetical protein